MPPSDGFPAGFGGAKIALFCRDTIIAYRRDDTPGLLFAGLWDLPGGGREGLESPVGCALREMAEEFGVVLAPGCVDVILPFRPVTPGLPVHCFLAGRITQDEIAAIRFGSEGQYWRQMPVTEYLGLPDAIPQLQQLVADYLRRGVSA